MTYRKLWIEKTVLCPLYKPIEKRVLISDCAGCGYYQGIDADSIRCSYREKGE